MALADRLLNLANAEGGGPVADGLHEAASLLVECEMAFERIAGGSVRPGHIAYMSKEEMSQVAERLLGQLQSEMVAA